MRPLAAARNRFAAKLPNHWNKLVLIEAGLGNLRRELEITQQFRFGDMEDMHLNIHENQRDRPALSLNARTTQLLKLRA